MKSALDALVSLLRAPQVTDFVDPTLGVLVWRPVRQAWVSGMLAEHRPFYFEFTRHKKETAPSEECIRVARDIACSPGTIEEQVRLQLSYATAQRSSEVRAGVESLRISCVVLGLAAEKVTGEVLLHGDPSSSNWVVWHENGVPSLATQHWE
jgi:hypothetical protein